MSSGQYIPAIQFCTQHQIDQSFIHLLSERGIMEIVILEENEFIPVEKLPLLEKCMHLHYELEINIEGIEAIQHLLQKIEDLQHEIQQLKNRLNFYEPEHES